MNRWIPAWTFLGGILFGYILGLDSSPSSYAPPPKKEIKTFVIATSLNVREQPSTSAKILTTMKRGEVVSMIKRQGKWTQIKARQGTAWVHSSFIGSEKDVQRAIEKVEREKAEKEKAKRQAQYVQERAAAKRQKELRAEAYKQKQSENRVALFKQWAAEIEKGCNSRLAVFRKQWLGSWQLTLTTYPNAHTEWIGSVFPNDYNKVERTLEEIGAGDPVPYATYLRHIKMCK